MSVSGFFLINKPVGITSHDVIYRLRKVVSEKTIGHAGTLDPNASGLLIVAIGRKFTKQIDNFKNLDKIYNAEVTLGQNSPTDDTEGELVFVSSDKPTELVVQKSLNILSNKTEQIPPQFSAKKIKGKTAYSLARLGKKMDLASVKVKIYKIDLLNYEYPKINFRCEVSSGTYIRSIARDLGKILNTGGHLSGLVRESIGKYSLKNSIDINHVVNKSDLYDYKINYE